MALPRYSPELRRTIEICYHRVTDAAAGAGGVEHPGHYNATTVLYTVNALVQPRSSAERR